MATLKGMYIRPFRMTEKEQLADAQHQRDKKAAIQRLEKKFKSRGLKFTTGFQGAIPVQAYGHIEGMRFYFRYRGGVAHIIVGPHRPDLEKALRTTKPIRRARISKKAKARLSSDVSQYYPVEVHWEASVLFGDTYDGFLTPKKSEQVFTMLMNTAPRVKHPSERIHPATKARLHGPEAYAEWLAGWRKRNKGSL